MQKPLPVRVPPEHDDLSAVAVATEVGKEVAAQVTAVLPLAADEGR